MISYLTGKTKILAIGLMSGTSVDGIDAALVEINDRNDHLETNLIAGHTYPYPADLRAEILAVCAGASRSLPQICELDDRIAESFAEAAIAIISKSDRRPDLIGSHGQTVFHRPPSSIQMGYTVQLGRGAMIAELTGIKTVSDFRVADIEAGGHGAPLVSIVDALLLSHPTKHRVCQNIGGISNLTYLPPNAPENQDIEHQDLVFGFDNGPGNMLIDMTTQRLCGEFFDRDGAMARQGKPDLSVIEKWLEQEFFVIPPPKSTGRELFSADYLEKCLSECQGLTTYDMLATLTEFTARAIAKSYRDFLPVFPDQVIVSGGGGHNCYLMERLQNLLAPAIVMRTDDLGISSDSKEAIAFAVLGYLRIKERFGNLPNVTGAKRSVVLGKIYQ